MNHVWSYDFVAERTEDGRQLRLLVVIDEYTRECLATEVGRSFRSRDVIDVLRYTSGVSHASVLAMLFVQSPNRLRGRNGVVYLKTVCFSPESFD